MKGEASIEFSACSFLRRLHFVHQPPRWFQINSAVAQVVQCQMQHGGCEFEKFRQSQSSSHQAMTALAW